MSAQVDEATVRQFIEIISAHAAQDHQRRRAAGLLQLCRIHPDDERSSAEPVRRSATSNTWRRRDRRRRRRAQRLHRRAHCARGAARQQARGLEDTMWVFGLVADCDADKGKGGNVTVKPTIMSETSPGNLHCWFLLAHAASAAQAKLIGDAIRASSGADQDTGVVTQCYRVAGTPNFPSAAKRARGRITIEPTKLILGTPAGCGIRTSCLPRLRRPDERRRGAAIRSHRSLLRRLAPRAPSPQAGGPTSVPTRQRSRTTCSTSSAMAPRRGADRSKVFHNVVAQLERRHWTIDAIVELLERYPRRDRREVLKRLRKEVERSYGKVATVPRLRSVPARCGGWFGRLGCVGRSRAECGHHTSRHSDYPSRRREATRDRRSRLRALDRRGVRRLRARRHAGRAGQRDHGRGRRAQDRHRAAAPLVGQFLALACRRCRDLSSVSTASVMPGSMSIRPCSWCAWCWQANGDGPSRA